MNAWDRLEQELDAWAATSQLASFWWRDDDATRACAALDRLLGISESQQVPVAVSVIPRSLDRSLRDRLDGNPLVAVLQHGWSHENHAGSDANKAELGPHRPRDAILADVIAGRDRIIEFEGGLPILVAPWNRIDARLLPSLPGIGISGVSMLGPRPRAEPTYGLRCVNVHADILEWRSPGVVLAEEAALAEVIGHLRLRRLGGADPDEPTGLLTHHLDHDDACWRFVESLVTRVVDHPAAEWLDVRDAFWP